MNARPQTRSHAATQSFKKQKHHGPRSRKVKKTMNAEAKARKLPRRAATVAAKKALKEVENDN